jgi:NAD(P)-dependent dehydrogenase (short-subunit alcohol dehydrogenase family)
MMTKAFALNGAHKVYIVGRRKSKLEETAALSPDNIVPIVGDVTDKESLLAVAAQIKRESGHVDLLCCNSGTMPDPIPLTPSTTCSVTDYAAAALAQDPQAWNTAFATNATSIAFTTFAFLELLAASNTPNLKPHVLVTTSIAGSHHAPGANMAYGASKAAATHLVKHLASTLAPFAIRVNGLAPGLFPSDLAEGLIGGVATGEGRDPREEGGVRKEVVPAGRTGREADLVGTVLWLTGRAGAYVSGSLVVLDGGRLSLLPGGI